MNFSNATSVGVDQSRLLMLKALEISQSVNMPRRFLMASPSASPAPAWRSRVVLEWFRRRAWRGRRKAQAQVEGWTGRGSPWRCSSQVRPWKGGGLRAYGHRARPGPESPPSDFGKRLMYGMPPAVMGRATKISVSVAHMVTAWGGMGEGSSRGIIFASKCWVQVGEHCGQGCDQHC
jgi:hypothetical protein